MQFTSQAKGLTKILFAILLFAISIFSAGMFASTHAAQRPLSDEEKTRLLEGNFKNCPESLKQELMDDTNTYYVDGTYIISRDQDGNVTEYLNCNSIADIEKLFVKIFGFITSIVGSVFAFGVGKSGVLMMTAGNDSDKFETSLSSLKTSIGSTMGVFFSYIVLTFILTGILGVGTNKKNEWNILCQQRIVIDLTVADSTPSCTES